MNKQFLFIAILCISVSSWCQKTIEFADSIRIAFNIPELSYAVVDSKSTKEIAALGKHSIALSDKANLNDRFHLGSNTKAMTGFVIAKYVEAGKLGWSTKFFDLFPKWKEKSKPQYYNITLQDLLSHRAGLPSFQEQPGFNSETAVKTPDFKGSKQEKRSQYGQYTLTFEPEKSDTEHPFIYSNADYVLATLMLEKVTGKSWEQLIEKVFNTDLKLDIKFSWPENQKQKDTWGHSFENNKWMPIPSNSKNKIELDEPAGDLNIKLKDYLKFIQLNLRGLKGEDNYLKSTTYQFIHKGIPNYSIGWFNISENGKEYSTHGGTVGTYYTQVHIDRQINMAYVIFTNSFSENTVQGVRFLMRKLKDNYNH